MSAKIDSREVLRRFHTLKYAAAQFAKDLRDQRYHFSAEENLHDAALAYAAAVAKVARRGRAR